MNTSSSENLPPPAPLAPVTDKGDTPRPSPPLLTPTPRDWIFLSLIVLAGGSSFSAIRVAVDIAPPALVAAGRLWVAALTLTVYALGTGRAFPPLWQDGRPTRAWLFAIAGGIAGYGVPMFLFPFAQQTVSSMLAGIYMAFMPIATVVLAASFADEPLTKRKIAGTAAGLCGVIILIGPSALGGIFTADVVAQLALLLATTGYSVSSVITRRAPDVPARSYAAMMMLSGAVFATPAALVSGGVDTLTGASMTAILYLGIVPTAISTILIVHMVRSAGAGFLAVGNYMTPGAAIIFGILIFGEALAPRYLIGLLAILGGVFIAQPGPALALLRKLGAMSRRRSGL